MDAAEFDYPLPPAGIAQTPAEPRDAARLLVDRGPAAAPDHRTVADLPDLLGPGDVLVVNDTRVIPARLHLRKRTGGAVEVLLLERRPDGWWEALVRPGRRVRPGTVLATSGSDAQVEVGEALGDGRRLARLVRPARDAPSAAGAMSYADELALLDGGGEMPLPPYIHTPLADDGRYQTVF